METDIWMKKLNMILKKNKSSAIKIFTIVIITLIVSEVFELGDMSGNLFSGVLQPYDDLVEIMLVILPALCVLLFDWRKIKKIENKLANKEKEMLKQDKLLQSISDATYQMLKTANLDEAISEALAIVGEASNVNQIYIYENNYTKKGPNSAVKRYEWSNNPLAASTVLQTFLYEEGLENWYSRLSAGRYVGGLIEDFSNTERKLLLSRGAKALLILPIFIEEVFWGFVGFEDCSEERRWAVNEISLLMAAAASFGGAIKRHNQEVRYQEVLKEDYRLTVQNMQNAIYKVRMDDRGEAIFTLCEGRVAFENNLSTVKVFGKTPQQVLPEEAAVLLNNHLRQAFGGNVVNFEMQIGDRVFYHTLSPIFNEADVEEVVGSAIDITERKNAEDHINYLAHYDTLTDLPNRVVFNDHLRLAISQAKRRDGLLAVMFIDLDRFKNINDTLGHVVGDQLLMLVADRLQGCIRDGDTVSRLGGDEFTILFPEISNTDDAAKIAQKILNEFKNPLIVQGSELFVTPSIGISIYPHDGSECHTLIQNADVAMYRAKEDGRNNYRLYTSVMNDKAVERLTLETELRRALDRKEFELYYQPLIDIRSGTIFGIEALIRWNHPKLGKVFPVDFIHLAEETGMILPIGDWVLKTACRQGAEWQKNYPGLRMAVNMTPRQFSQINLFEKISSILEETGFAPDLLEMEITEESIMHNSCELMETLNKLKSIGIRLSVDDFGTGFSSLSYLKLFSLDTLKIDRSFVQDVENNHANAEITKAIIMIAKALNLTVIAEGVETEAQIKFLWFHRCDFMQGYYYSEPVDKDSLERLLESEHDYKYLANG